MVGRYLALMAAGSVVIGTASAADPPTRQQRLSDILNIGDLVKINGTLARIPTGSVATLLVYNGTKSSITSAIVRITITKPPCGKDVKCAPDANAVIWLEDHVCDFNNIVKPNASGHCEIEIPVEFEHENDWMVATMSVNEPEKPWYRFWDKSQ